MSAAPIDSANALADWFRGSGIGEPLDVCTDPFPGTGILLARWSKRQADDAVHVMRALPCCYRITLMLESVDAQIWADARSVWSGIIGANRYRICAPSPDEKLYRLGRCDNVSLFVPVQTVDRFSRLSGTLGSLGDTSFVSDRHVQDLIRRMLDAQQTAGALASQYCDGLATALLCHLMERHGDARAGSSSGLRGTQLRKVLAFIGDNLHREIPIAEMARLCAMSESHFSRAFRAAAGLPPGQYAMNLRLERACEALKLGTERMLDIALEHGFCNASHFSRAFAQRYGMPPVRYRQLNTARG